MRLRELQKILRILGGHKRVEIIKLLLNGEELSVGEIASQIKLSHTATSKHVVMLRQAGLLDRRQAGFEAKYWLEKDLPHQLAALVKLIRKASN
ncbi:MAG: Transcription activator HlyU [Parcubacteria group bacterium GW2011_GWD2_43_10]|uniref:HTH arsR-type domain-containing protein n=5 Tax=Candidatus Vebleniibacteriota TaxID=1817921 RepID=A0A1G2Q547_9BACT|nr:MAG: Transcription activator HlyU [Parcubacteria group bacterium GW2011_GWA2_42_80]KKS79360.1 MAG: Transcription activator HlyU [Parcubacteria group bacterium GW2011_GWD1_42_9]KKS82740.1 MAG: Transcription activator HlyU [Parcubacteria group bacterium GW2011_GWD2_43_10]KKT12881.1 MAG: Transcription activator HlyU [Parcubacteria group bacterium GW2011_GWA1_43_27]OHA54766.1 MAG: hypothetical protein A2388_00370 [Candidatus Veblenbacteria bacterium RIFOXYB1_FULL_43_13]OHA55723.1 MAG: hypotheti